MPHHGKVQVQHHTAERRAGCYSVRHPLSDFELSEPSQWTRRAPMGRECLVRRTHNISRRNLLIISLRSGAEAHSLLSQESRGNLRYPHAVPFLPQLLFVDFPLTINRISCWVVSSSIVMLTDVSERCLRCSRCDKDLAVKKETWYSR